MLRLPTRVLRIKAAVALAIMYGFCALAPSLAFAIFDHSAVPFCLTGAYPSPLTYAGAERDHDGSIHHHADHGASHEDSSFRSQSPNYEPSASHEHPLKRGNPADCCVLCAMAGLSGEVLVAFGPPHMDSTPLPALIKALDGRGPERINRPPIG
jgi:hypothetical protein